MSRREGGRRRFSEGEGGVGEDEVVEEPAGEGVARSAEEVEGVTGRDFALAFERSIHGFSGGIRGTVYCARALRDMSHRLGTQTPTRTRQAATSRLELQGIRTGVRQGYGVCAYCGRDVVSLTDRSCLVTASHKRQRIMVCSGLGRTGETHH